MSYCYLDAFIFSHACPSEFGGEGQGSPLFSIAASRSLCVILIFKLLLHRGTWCSSGTCHWSSSLLSSVTPQLCLLHHGCGQQAHSLSPHSAFYFQSPEFLWMIHLIPWLGVCPPHLRGPLFLPLQQPIATCPGHCLSPDTDVIPKLLI